jgi:hypothetical protein
MISKSIKLTAVLVVLFSTPAIAQQVIYPAKGQSAQQQQKDEAECYTWAKGQTGFDPAAPQNVAPPPQQAVAPASTRSVGGGMAKGAVVGATVGAIGDNDVGNAAAKGAVVGGIARGSRNRGAQQQQQQQQQAASQQQAAAQQQQGAQQQNFQRAYGACFEGRGYTVK